LIEADAVNVDVVVSRCGSCL